ncbi:MAG: adenylate/guanylate cyclase domain-containing protein [Candidatus Desulfacyla sp.]
MSRPDCISNRNIRIIAAYVKNRTGRHPSLFDGLSYPRDEYLSAEDFFLNEDEWTTYDNFERVFRKARDLVGETDFFFNCGASSARLRSWGRFHYFVRVFATPDDGYQRLPFFNKNFDDTKEIEVISPPAYDPDSRKVRTLLKVEFHTDFDPNGDYIGDPYLRGILSSIPTIWGLPPAVIRQPLLPYDPEVLFNQDPEFTPYRLDVRIEADVMTLKAPGRDGRLIVGKRVLLAPEVINGKEVFLGKYAEIPTGSNAAPHNQRKAILITETLRMGDRLLFTAGEIYMAPYFILDVSYDRLSVFRGLSQIFRIRNTHRDSGEELVETINQLRKSMASRNQAYVKLESTLSELMDAKARLDEINRELENRVEKRTLELREAQQELLLMNRNLEAKVKAQVIDLERHNQLRRYLSPKLAEKILSSEDTLWTEPQRKMMTVVFTDIRGFSALTDSLEPEELFQLLSTYHSEMIRIVHDYDGTLNKIVGDGLLIFFGDPIPMDDHADRAVRMAMDMQRKVADLSDEWNRYGHRLGVGIGINSGYATVGNVGSDAYSDYTVIGNQVNVASRLEAASGPGQILISQRTCYMLKGAVEVEEMGDIEVKGIHTPIKTYSVVWQSHG